jgi:arylsulfatase A-like enzyme
MLGTTINGSSNGPLRGSKRQTWEGGIRVPFIIRWKGHVPEGKTDARPIIQLDVLPTALAAAGIPLGNQSEVDGVNLLPFISGKNQGLAHEALYWRLGGMMAIRKGDWKLVKTQEGPISSRPISPERSLGRGALQPRDRHRREEESRASQRRESKGTGGSVAKMES